MPIASLSWVNFRETVEGSFSANTQYSIPFPQIASVGPCDPRVGSALDHWHSPHWDSFSLRLFIPLTLYRLQTVWLFCCVCKTFQSIYEEGRIQTNKTWGITKGHTLSPLQKKVHFEVQDIINRPCKCLLSTTVFFFKQRIEIQTIFIFTSHSM